MKLKTHDRLGILKKIAITEPGDIAEMVNLALFLGNQYDVIYHKEIAELITMYNRASFFKA